MQSTSWIDRLQKWALFMLLFTASTQGFFKGVLRVSSFFEVSLVIISIFCLANLIVHLKYKMFRTFGFLFALLFVAISSSGLLNGASNRLITKGIYVYWLVPFTFIMLLIRPINPKKRYQFINIFCAIVIMNSVISIYRFFVDPTLGGYYSVTYRTTLLYRAGDLSAESIVFGPTMALITGFLFSVYLKSREKKYLACGILSSFSAVLSLSRASIFILLFVGIGIIIYLKKSLTPLKMLALCFFGLVFSLLILYSLQFQITKDAITEIGSFSKNQEYNVRIITIKDMFSEGDFTEPRTALFGLGPGYIQPSTLDEIGRLPFVVESYWFTIFGEVGILGLAALVGLYWCAVKFFIKSYGVFWFAIISLFIVNVFSASMLGVYTQAFLWAAVLLLRNG